jgi:hypothetical protein
MKPLGQLTTYIGRTLIEQSKSYTEGLFMEEIKKEKLLVYPINKIEIDLSDKEKLKYLSKFKIK